MMTDVMIDVLLQPREKFSFASIDYILQIITIERSHF